MLSEEEVERHKRIDDYWDDKIYGTRPAIKKKDAQYILFKGPGNVYDHADRVNLFSKYNEIIKRDLELPFYYLYSDGGNSFKNPINVSLFDYVLNFYFCSLKEFVYDISIRNYQIILKNGAIFKLDELANIDNIYNLDNFRGVIDNMEWDELNGYRGFYNNDLEIEALPTGKSDFFCGDIDLHNVHKDGFYSDGMLREDIKKLLLDKFLRQNEISETDIQMFNNLNIEVKYETFMWYYDDTSFVFLRKDYKDKLEALIDIKNFYIATYKKNTLPIDIYKKICSYITNS